MDTTTHPLIPTEITTDTVTAPLARFTAPARFAGPPGIANGGWLAGQLASHLVPEGSGFPHPAIEVTLRAPTPVDRDLAVEQTRTWPRASARGVPRTWPRASARGVPRTWPRASARGVPADGVRLIDGEHVLAEARLADACPLAPAPVDRAAAALAEVAYVGWWDHPFVDCFVCGLRHLDERLQVFTGPVEGRPGVVAGRWTVPSWPTGGPTPTQLLWAALDCPTAWVHHRPGDAALLGRLTGQIHRPVAPGEPLVVVAQADARHGRRRHSRGGLYDQDSRLVAASQAVWIEAR